MKKSLFKRSLSAFLAVLMVVTSIPFVASASVPAYVNNVISPTQWNLVASSDFAALSSLGDTASTSYQVQVPTTSEGGNPMTWTAINYADNGNVVFNSDGMYLSDGYFYLSGYDNVATPITGASEWKIEMEFKFNESWEFSTNGIFSGNTKTDRYAWLVMGTGTAYTKESNTVGSTNNVLGHDAQGPVSSRGSYLSELKSTGYTFDLTENGGFLQAGVDYKYVVSYNKNYLKIHVEDSNGVIVTNLCGAYAPDFTVSDLTNICFGDDNNSEYFQKTTFKNIKMYTGTTTSGEKHIDTEKTYYLFSYFTANSEEGEKVHFAVSDDGTNFEPLNGNRQILSSDYSADNNTGSGVAATNNVRDPFCIPSADGSGYYFLGTDLDTVGGTNWANNSKLTIWFISDLSKADEAKSWSLDMQDYMSAYTDGGTVSRAWAPEAVWDPEVGMYMLFWSNGYCDGGYSGMSGFTTMYYAYTKDFKTLETEPKVLYYSPKSCIDGNLTYDGNLWYLVYKNESGDNTMIYYATSEHACGPFIGATEFSDSDSDKLEGCEIYQTIDGEYIFMADSYSNPSRFAMYKGANIDTIIRNNIASSTTTNINHCRPRHGYVVNITEEEYHDLIHTYGKAVFDSSVVHDDEDVNDYLVARYFVSADPTADVVGGNTLSNNGVTMSNNIGGKVAAVFTNSAWAEVDVTNMLQDITAKDGVTLSWYGYPTASNSGRYFDWSTAEEQTMVWDNADYATNAYAYCDSAIEFGVDNYGSPVLAEGYESSSSYLNTWNLYTMTITDSYVTFFINGQLCRTIYSKDLSSISTQGTPLEVQNMNEDYFNVMKTQMLRFGISSWGADSMFEGYISDFRVYDKALSAFDVADSLAALDVIPNTAVDLENRDYYDPMENLDTDGDGTYDKTAYTATVEDPQTIQGLVLNATGGVTSHNPATTADVKSSDEGYTISMFYDPAATIGSGNIFNIGDGSTQYLELTEDGQLCFSNGGGQLIAKNIFGDSSLSLNTSTHITLQFIPNGGLDKVYVYLDGILVNTIDTFTDASGTNTLSAGESIVTYLQSTHNVYYGTTAGQANGVTNCTNGYIDDFSIYSGLYSASSIFSNDCIAIADSLLGIAMNSYKEKMASIPTDGSFVYTNMANAYTAYDKVLRYYYAIAYGQVPMNAAEVVELYTALNDELSKMEKYTGPDTIEGLDQTTTGLATSIPAQFTQNMLTGVNLATKYEYADGTYNNINNAILSGSFVWLYDGVNTPTAPIGGGSYRNNTFGTRRTRSIYTTSSELVLGGSLNEDTSPVASGHWHFTFNTTPDWYYNTITGEYMAELASTASVYVQDTFTASSKTTWYYGSNYISYVGDPGSAYYSSFDPVYYGEDNSTNQRLINSTGTIYIVNAKPAMQAMTDAQNIVILNNITEYSPESAWALVSAYDELTAIDYTMDGTQAAALQSNADSVSSLASLIEEKVENLLAQDPEMVLHKADYETLGELANSVEEYINSAVYDSETGLVIADEAHGGDGTEMYTQGSWNAILDSYNDIVAHCASLNPFGDNEYFVTDPETITRLIDIFQVSLDRLIAVADYTPVDSVTASGSDTFNAIYNGNGDSYDTQDYAYYSWNSFEIAYDAADALADSINLIRYNMPKYYVEFENSEYGRYIPIDVNGNYVTDANTEVVCYSFVTEFYAYDSATGTYEIDFTNTGSFIKDADGNYIDVTGYRYGNMGVDSATLSDGQTEINTTGANVTTTYNALVPLADYAVYDAAVEAVDSQDMGAFTTDYINSESSVYGLLDTNGTKEESTLFTNGVASANAKTVSTDAFTNQVGTAYVIGSNGNIFKNAGQDQLDLQTSSVISELNAANADTTGTKRTQYTVTFKVVVDGVETTVSTTTANYGESVALDASSVAGDAVCNSWAITNGGATHRFVNYSNTYTVNIQSDVTVVAYCTAGVTDSAPLDVTVYNQYNQKLHQVATSGDTTVTFTANSATFTTNGESTIVSVPVMPNYTIESWYVGNVTLTNGTSYTLSDLAGSNTTLEFAPNVTATDSNTYSITLDGVEVVTGAYDDMVTVSSSANGVYALAVNQNGEYSVAAYGTSYSFYINRDIDFESIVKDTAGNYYYGSTSGTQITDAQMISKLNGMLPFVYSGTGISNSRYTTYSASTANTAAVVTEVGTVYSKSVSDADSLVIGGTGCGTFAATNQLSTKQYSLSVKTTGTLYTRAYVKYTVSYTDANGNVATIQTIDYGNVCTHTGL